MLKNCYNIVVKKKFVDGKKIEEKIEMDDLLLNERIFENKVLLIDNDIDEYVK